MPLFLVKVINRFLFTFELFIASSLFYSKLEKRRFWYIRILGYFLTMVGLTCLYVVLKDSLMALVESDTTSLLYFWVAYLFSVLYEVMAIGLCFLIVFITFKTSITNSLFIACVSFSLQNIATSLLSLILLNNFTNGTFTIRYFAEPFGIIAYILVYVFVYVILYFIFIRKWNSGYDNFLTKGTLAIVVSILLIDIILCSLDSPQNSEDAKRLFLFMLISRIALGIIALTLLFYMLNWQKKKIEYNNLHYIMERQKEQYVISKENMEKVNINAHDLRHQISLLMQVVNKSNGDNEKLTTYLKGMEEYVDVADMTYKTGNDALDVVMNEKSRICREKFVQLSAMIDGNSLSFISEFDIYVFFGNAIDNAIHGTEKKENKDERTISLMIKPLSGGVSIHIENTMNETPMFIDGLPVTTEKDNRIHGYGTKSMKSIAQKYNGNLLLKAKDNVFYLDCYIPFPSNV